MSCPFRVGARVELLLLLLSLTGCGGQLGGADEDDVPVDGAGEEGTGGDDGSDGGEDEELGPGDLVLDECELGFLPSESEAPCNWLADNRCYETKALACSCLCPRDESSLCLSDFYGGEGSRTKVTCR